MDKSTLAKQGIDVDDALNRFMGNQPLYVKCPRQFLEDENHSKLMEALDVSDYEGAFRYAHTLKGVVGNLSLTDLYAAVVPLVESLRHEEYSQLDAQRQAVEATYETAIAAIKTIQD